MLLPWVSVTWVRGDILSPSPDAAADQCACRALDCAEGLEHDKSLRLSTLLDSPPMKPSRVARFRAGL